MSQDYPAAPQNAKSDPSSPDPAHPDASLPERAAARRDGAFTARSLQVCHRGIPVGRHGLVPGNRADDPQASIARCLGGRRGRRRLRWLDCTSPAASRGTSDAARQLGTGEFAGQLRGRDPRHPRNLRPRPHLHPVGGPLLRAVAARAARLGAQTSTARRGALDADGRRQLRARLAPLPARGGPRSARARSGRRAARVPAGSNSRA
jgi:hypothetical protein